MGVRGLTTFLAQHSDKYLRRYELHDTYLVIDGNNLAFQLYKWHCRCYDCFGGDYDKFAQVVVKFFDALRECNVTPLIVFDGGYENKKLKTIYSRVRTRIRQAKNLNSANEDSMTVFPLFIRELFCEILLKMKLRMVRCLVEADFEMASISRKLGCPVLSYDSDFYIFDVSYIPFNTLLFNVTKKSKSNYQYLDCQIYKVDYFLQAYKGLRKDCIPLLGVLLGNDYIKIGVFSNFYRHLKLIRRKSDGSDQQTRIKSLITWLRNETFDSAVRKILGRTKQIYRKRVAEQILSLANSYVCCDTQLLEYLNITDDSAEEIVPTKIIIDVDNIDEVESERSDDEENSENAERDKEVNILVEDEIECLDSKLPEYFEREYMKCRYPASAIDIIIHNRYIFIPIIEDFYKPQCHNISLEILSAIAEILNPNSEQSVKYILRNEKGRMQKYKLPKTTKILPTINELETISQAKSLEFISDVLEINAKLLNLLQQFPTSWQLYIVCVIYWVRHSNPAVNECYLYGLLLSGIVLKTIGITSPRNTMKFSKIYTKDVLRIENNPITPVTTNTMNVNTILNSISNDEKIILMKELIRNFDMTIKMRGNPKLFDSGIVHVFAEFQSCAYHIKYLNCLLNNPFEDYLISDFYDGTLIYNLTNNFLSRPQLDAYVESLLRVSPNIHNAFIAIKSCVKSYCTDVSFKNPNVKRRRKKKKKVLSENMASDEQSDCDDDVEEVIYDVNNRFSVLKLVNR